MSLSSFHVPPLLLLWCHYCTFCTLFWSTRMKMTSRDNKKGKKDVNLKLTRAKSEEKGIRGRREWNWNSDEFPLNGLIFPSPLSLRPSSRDERRWVWHSITERTARNPQIAFDHRFLGTERESNFSVRTVRHVIVVSGCREGHRAGGGRIAIHPMARITKKCMRNRSWKCN